MKVVGRLYVLFIGSKVKYEDRSKGHKKKVMTENIRKFEKKYPRMIFFWK